MMWSVWNGAGCEADRSRQYSEHPEARSRTLLIISASTLRCVYDERKDCLALDCITAKRLLTWM